MPGIEAALEVAGQALLVPGPVTKLMQGRGEVVLVALEVGDGGQGSMNQQFR
jgi:hypothetical protein